MTHVLMSAEGLLRGIRLMTSCTKDRVHVGSGILIHLPLALYTCAMDYQFVSTVYMIKLQSGGAEWGNRYFFNMYML